MALPSRGAAQNLDTTWRSVEKLHNRLPGFGEGSWAASPRRGLSTILPLRTYQSVLLTRERLSSQSCEHWPLTEGLARD
jgi:hypothetical protein